MTRRTLWLVAAILGLSFPLISTAGGPAASQAPDTQAAKPAAPGDAQASDPAKADDDTPDEPVQAGQPAPPPAPDKAGTPDEPVQAGQPAPPPQQPDPTPKQSGEDRADVPVQPAATVPAPIPVQPAPPRPPPKTPEEAKQRQLEQDTAELLQLAHELKVEVDKAGKDTLSLAAVRKADEIQKLAKNLREGMRELAQVHGNGP